jgi:hypothetical protein
MYVTYPEYNASADYPPGTETQCSQSLHTHHVPASTCWSEQCFLKFSAHFTGIYFSVLWINIVLGTQNILQECVEKIKG